MIAVRFTEKKTAAQFFSEMSKRLKDRNCVSVFRKIFLEKQEVG